MNRSFTFFLMVVIYFILPHGGYAQRVNVINAGISGNTTKDLLERLKPDVIDVDPSVVILIIGTNDMLNTKKMISYKEYQNNLGLILQSLRESNTKTLLVSPPPVDETYLYKRHHKDRYSSPPNEKLDSISRIMETLSMDFGVHFIDMNQRFQDKGIPDHNNDLYIKNNINSGEEDGVHPTAKGYQFIATVLFEFLQKLQWLEDGSTIVCLGDSITYGKNVEGQGTVTGKTYPAVLAGLISSEKQY